VWLIATVVQSIFMTRYDDPTFILETPPSQDHSLQPLFVRISFTEKTSLIAQIEEWFTHVFGCGAQVSSAGSNT